MKKTILRHIHGAVLESQQATPVWGWEDTQFPKWCILQFAAYIFSFRSFAQLSFGHGSQRWLICTALSIICSPYIFHNNQGLHFYFAILLYRLGFKCFGLPHIQTWEGSTGGAVVMMGGVENVHQRVTNSRGVLLFPPKCLIRVQNWSPSPLYPAVQFNWATASPRHTALSTGG